MLKIEWDSIRKDVRRNSLKIISVVAAFVGTSIIIRVFLMGKVAAVDWVSNFAFIILVLTGLGLLGRFIAHGWIKVQWR